MIIQSRRGFITRLVSLLAAPAIVRAGSLMPVKSIEQFTLDDYYDQLMYPMLDQLKQTIISIHYYMEDGSVAVKTIPENEFYK